LQRRYGISRSGLGSVGNPSVKQMLRDIVPSGREANKRRSVGI